MTEQDAIQLTNDFKVEVIRLVHMERGYQCFQDNQLRQQRERVAVLEAAIRTALLHSA